MNNPESFEPVPNPGVELGRNHLSFSDCEPCTFDEQAPDETSEHYAQRQMVADENRFIVGLVRSATRGVDGMKSAMTDSEDYRITDDQRREVWNAVGAMTREEYEDTVNSVWSAFPEEARESAKRIADHLLTQSRRFAKKEAEAAAAAEIASVVEELPEESSETPNPLTPPTTPETPMAPDRILSPREAALLYRGEKQKRRGGFFKKFKNKVREIITGDSDDYDEEETFKPWGATPSEPLFAINRRDGIPYPEPVPAGRLFTDDNRFSTEHAPGHYFGRVEEVATDPGDPIEPPITESGSSKPDKPSTPRGLRPTQIPDIGRPMVPHRPGFSDSETDPSSLGRPSIFSHIKGAAPLPKKAPGVFHHLGDTPFTSSFPKKGPSVLHPVSPLTPPTEGGKGPEDSTTPPAGDGATEPEGKPRVSSPEGEKPVTSPATPPIEVGKGPGATPEASEVKRGETPETGEKKPEASTVEIDGESVSIGEFVSRLIKERARVEGTSLDESVKKGKWNKETLSHIGADGAPREWAQLTGWLKKHPEEMARFTEEYETLKTKPAPGEDTGTDIGDEHLPFSKFKQTNFDSSRHLDVKNNDFETVSEYEERLRARNKRRFIAYFLAQQSGGSEAAAALKGAEDFNISEEQEKQFENAVQGMDDEEYSRTAKQALEAAIPDDEEHTFAFPGRGVTNAHADEIREYYWNGFARKIKPESEAIKKKRIENWEEVKKAGETAPAEPTDTPEDKKAA